MPSGDASTSSKNRTSPSRPVSATATALCSLAASRPPGVPGSPACSTGRLTTSVINAVAEFERDLLVERTQAGLDRAKAAGKALGRPSSLTAEQRREVGRRLQEGAGVSALARDFRTSRQTILRVRDAMTAS